MREKFKSGQEYASWHNEARRDYSPTHMKIAALFTERIWRGWRALGTDGGHGAVVRRLRRGVQRPERRGGVPFVPGGADLQPESPQGVYFSNRPEGGFQLSAAGRALVGNNRETLAFVGGKIVAADNASVLDKQHAFWSGAPVEKSIVLINDHRTPQPYSCTWRATLDGKVIASGSKSGTIGVAQNRFLPIAFPAPAVPDKRDGVIELTAKIGGRFAHG
jgi:hypothetical protein